MQRPFTLLVRSAWSRLVKRLASGIVLARTESERDLQIRLITPVPIVGLIVAAAAYIAWPGSATAITAGALLAAIVCSLWMIRAQALGLSAERRLTYAPLQVGDEIEEEIALYNDSGLPVIARLDDASTLPGYSLISVQAVAAHAARTWRMRALCSRRGIATLGPWSAAWRDPFGLFEARVRFGQRQEVVVVPPLARVSLTLAARRARIGDRATLRQPLRADSAQAAGVREYAVGDPVHRVHWPTSARRQSLFVKQLDPESASDVWLVPDFNGAALAAGDDDEAPLERLILLVVATAEQLLAQRLRVGLAYALDTPVVVPARIGRGQLWPILRALAPVQTSDRRFSEVLAEVGGIIPTRARSIAISADVDADWPALALASRRVGGLDLILMDTDSDAKRAWRMAESLQQRGWSAQAVAAAEIQPQLGAFGPLRRWEFRALGTGRIVAQQTPRRQQELEGLRP